MSDSENASSNLLGSHTQDSCHTISEAEYYSCFVMFLTFKLFAYSPPSETQIMEEL